RFSGPVERVSIPGIGDAGGRRGSDTWLPTGWPAGFPADSSWRDVETVPPLRSHKSLPSEPRDASELLTLFTRPYEKIRTGKKCDPLSRPDRFEATLLVEELLDVLNDLVVIRPDTVVELSNLAGLIDEVKMGSVHHLIRFGIHPDLRLKGFPGQLLNFLEGITRQEVPVGKVDLVLLGELVDRLLIIPLRIDAEGDDFDVQPLKFQPLLEEGHIGRHRRAS